MAKPFTDKFRKEIKAVIKEYAERSDIPFMDIMKDPRIKGKVGWTSLRHWLDMMKRNDEVKPALKRNYNRYGGSDPTTDADIEMLKEQAKVKPTYADIARSDYFKTKGWDKSRVSRYCIENKISLSNPNSKQSEKSREDVMRQLETQYTLPELKQIAKGGRVVVGQTKVPDIHFDGTRFRFGCISDMHTGSKYLMPQHWDLAVKTMKDEKVECVFIPGDVTEGLKLQRTGHAFELELLGFAPQKSRAVELLSMINTPLYVIGGNHDEWFINANNANVVEDICQEVPQANYLGYHEGDVTLKDKVVARMFHGLKGSAYAISYSPQKTIEEIPGGDKPNIFIQGHYHKYATFFYRHVHVIMPGAICTQSAWMKSKSLGNHTGFTITDVWINKDGISKINTTFYPYYS